MDAGFWSAPRDRLRCMMNLGRPCPCWRWKLGLAQEGRWRRQRWWWWWWWLSGGGGGSGLASVGNLTRPRHATTKNYRYTSVEREGELYINTCLTIWSTTRASSCCTWRAPARFCAVFLRWFCIAITFFFFSFENEYWGNKVNKGEGEEWVNTRWLRTRN